MANMINSLKFDDNNIYPFSLPYGVCSTAAGTAAKTVTVDNFSLETGATVIVKFTNNNSAASPTLNVNSTGAKPIYQYGTAAASTTQTTSGWRAGAVQMFTYDGTGWVRNFWENTTLAIGTTATTAAAGNHTHNYAGSSSVGGAATSANKLNTNAGSVTQPVYFANGVPVQTTHTLSASVPSDAKFTDTQVTSVGNHYTPTADTTSALSVDASSTTAATWNSTSLVTGVNIQRDAKGHVTGLTVDSIKMPANPDTNTRYGAATSSDLGLVRSGGDVTVASDGTMSVADDSHNHTNYVKNTDYATSTKAGIVKVGTGLIVLDGAVQVYPATDSAINSKTGIYPLTPQYLDYAVKVGITTNTQTLTNEEKSNACTWLGALCDIDTFVIDGGTAEDV